MSYSQIGQDLKVVDFYNKKENGFFVEIGAADGIEYSNTYLLETKYNWKGVCCEPLPAFFEKLIINRPNSYWCNGALYNQSGLYVDFDIPYNDLCSGISQNINAHKEYVEKSKQIITVKTITLLDLLDRINAPLFIEYLSLDTEGSEYEILKNFDFSKYIFGLIHVEHNYVEPQRTHIRELLLSNGYIYIGPNDYDDMYKHSSV